MDPSALRVRVHYDFASSLCYVTHRVMERMRPTLDELGIALEWAALDLARLTGPYQPGVEIPELRRLNAVRVAAELGVPVHVPRVWSDSRPVNGAAYLAERAGRGATWRERVFTLLFEEQRPAPDLDETVGLAAELGFSLSVRDVERAQQELEVKTELAREEGVSGVPTFMLGSWPFGGIQSEETMRHVLARYASKARSGELVA
jgi:predicted DsbA family dithiol-disulfide isomerase